MPEVIPLRRDGIGGVVGQWRSPDDGEAVDLVVPAHRRFGLPVRLVAASLASDLGFSVADIIELRRAVDAGFASLIALPSPGPALRITFRAEQLGVAQADTARVEWQATGTPSRLRVAGTTWEPPILPIESPTMRGLTMRGLAVTPRRHLGAVPAGRTMQQTTDEYELSPGRFAFLKTPRAWQPMSH